MTKRKVIEDSDDEDNAEPSPPRPRATELSDIALSTVISPNCSPSHDMQDQGADSCTSSTELLNRELRAAHKRLIEPTPTSAVSAARREVSSQQQTPSSPTTSPSKTRRSKTSVEKPKAKKPLKTYGKGSQGTFASHGGSDGELDIKARMDPGHEARKRKKNANSKDDEATSGQAFQRGHVTRRPITSSGGDTELLSTEVKPQEFYSGCGQDVSPQSSMPPPVFESATFEQAQRSRNSVTTTIAEPKPSKSSASSLFPPLRAASVETHLDDQMTTLTWSSRGEVYEESSQGLFQSGNLHPVPSHKETKGVDLQSTIQATEEPAPTSSASEISPSKTITVKRTNETKTISQELSSHLDSGYLQAQLSSNTSTKPSPVVLLPTCVDIDGCHDELSLSIPEKAKSPSGPINAPKRNSANDNSPLDELGSDDNYIGIPKEQYQPRPSKRRSGDGTEEIFVPTDYSKKPEAMGKGKRKTKRHKTTAFQELLPQVEDEEEEVKVAPDPRFDIPVKKPPNVSTERGQPDWGQNDNTEEIRPEDQSEPKQATEVPGQRKRGRPKKAVTNLCEETVLDEADADHDQHDAEIEEPVISATAKKSRKKTKTKEAPMPIIDELDPNNGDAPAAGDDSEHLLISILNETNGNLISSRLAAKPLPEVMPVTANTPPETPRKPITPAPKGPDKHSPISSGNVAYRVGLSKRARIAPLLRIVRK